MRILFVYPAFAAITDKPRINPRLFTYKDLDVAVFDGVSVYYKDGKSRTEQSAQHARYNSYFIRIKDDLYTSANMHADDATFISRTYALSKDVLGDFISRSRNIAADLNAYNEEAEALTERRKAEREAEEIERKEKKAREAEIAKAQEQADYELAVAGYRKGEDVIWDHFEHMCREYGISLHMRTIGACRKNVNSVNRNGYNVSSGSKPDSLFQAIRELNKKLPLTETAA